MPVRVGYEHSQYVFATMLREAVREAIVADLDQKLFFPKPGQGL